MPFFQILSILGSISITLILIELVKSRRLKESYSLLWFAIAFVFLVFSVWRDLLELLAKALGIGYAPAALFLILIIGLYLVSLHYSVVISRLSERTKNLNQEIGILNLKIRKLEEEKKD
ncbi:MAG: DUF2304 domain-containing protein [Candidatus Pacebacteria bacterium]|nr:DUF2304 domain-containing protein [Candidatus Paceibacterota bacterium]